MHDGHSPLPVTGGDGRLNRGCPAISRQQRSMDIQTGNRGCAKEFRRKDAAVSHRYHHLGIQLANPFKNTGKTGCFRLQKRKGGPSTQRSLLDWRGLEMPMPARRTIRLGDDSYQFVPESQKIEGGNSDLPGACKKNAHGSFCPSDPERGSSRGPSERSLRHHGITGGYFPLPD